MKDAHRKKEKQHVDMLRAFSQSDRAQVPEALASVASDFIPHLLQHNSLGLLWVPSDIRDDVHKALPKAMASESLRRTSAWVNDHIVLDQSAALPVRPESRSQKRRRGCYEAGSCVCHKQGALRHAFCDRWHRALERALRIRSTIAYLPLKTV